MAVLFCRVTLSSWWFASGVKPEANCTASIRVSGVLRSATRLTLTDVITEVGGIKESSADAAGVFVIRPAVGSERLADVYQFDLRNSIAYVFSNQFRLTPNDIVYVSTTELGRLNRVIDQVTPALDLVNLTNTAETSLRDLVDLNE